MEATITSWEGNATAPAIRYIPAIIQFLGYDPLPPSASAFPERLAAARRGLGLSQQKMAEKLDVDLTTLQNALEEQLGLRLVTGKESLPVYVVESVKRPTAN